MRENHRLDDAIASIKIRLPPLLFTIKQAASTDAAEFMLGATHIMSRSVTAAGREKQ